MTREEAEVFMFGLKNYQWKQHPLLYEHVDLGLRMIYDDLESRTCENCKHLDNSGLGLFHYCKKVQHEVHGEYDDDSHMEDISVELDFGCNKWESK